MTRERKREREREREEEKKSTKGRKNWEEEAPSDPSWISQVDKEADTGDLSDVDN